MRHALPEGKAFDLHALGTPPAFVLSQDQTLHCMRGAEGTSDPRTGSDRTKKNGNVYIITIQL